MYGVNRRFEARAGDGDGGVAGEVDGEVAVPRALAGAAHAGQGLTDVCRRGREWGSAGEVGGLEGRGEGQRASAEVAANGPFDRHRPLLLLHVRRVEDP